MTATDTTACLVYRLCRIGNETERGRAHVVVGIDAAVADAEVFARRLADSGVLYTHDSVQVVTRKGKRPVASCRPCDDGVSVTRW